MNKLIFGDKNNQNKNGRDKKNSILKSNPRKSSKNY